MILADKIVTLRKRAGWSQEELAAQLGVSRQSVSKWEGAQSVPDMQKVVQMSRLFGVTTDYLLKEELGEPEPAPAESDAPLRCVTMEQAADYLAQRQAAAAGVPLYTVVSDPYSYPSLEKSAAKLMAFTVVIEECAELLTTLSLPDFYEEVMLRTGYLNMLEEKDDIEARTRAENIRELKSSILAYMENTDTPTLAGFLEEIALYTDIEQYDPDADAVVMMTMHAAKGLEFPNVFLTGFEEGLFPSNRCLSEPEELEEERRLCYVAITRAKQNLVISYARQRMLYGRTTTNLPSRFVDELPAESVKRVGAPKPSYSQQAPRQYGSFGRVSIYGDEYNDFSQIPTRPKPQKDYSVHTQPKPAPKVSFAAGEMVQHKAFGRGMILTVLPMGADALLEIAFDGVGTKRLMANTAAQHMKKL